MIGELNMAGCYSMEEQMKVSDLGVFVVSKYLEGLDNVFKIVNVEEDKKYQKKDIDLLAYMKVGEKLGWVSIEVKCDTYKSGNLYVETISNMSKNTPGCLMYSEAQYLFYFFEKLDELYIFPMVKFREWFVANKNKFSRKEPATKRVDGSILYKSEGYTVPLQYIKDNFKQVKVVNINKKELAKAN